MLIDAVYAQRVPYGLALVCPIGAVDGGVVPAAVRVAVEQRRAAAVHCGRGEISGRKSSRARFNDGTGGNVAGEIRRTAAQKEGGRLGVYLVQKCRAAAKHGV